MRCHGNWPKTNVWRDATINSSFHLGRGEASGGTVSTLEFIFVICALWLWSLDWLQSKPPPLRGVRTEQSSHRTCTLNTIIDLCWLCSLCCFMTACWYRQHSQSVSLSGRFTPWFGQLPRGYSQAKLKQRPSMPNIVPGWNMDSYQMDLHEIWCRLSWRTWRGS